MLGFLLPIIMLCMTFGYTPGNNQQGDGAVEIKNWEAVLYNEDGTVAEGFPQAFHTPGNMGDLPVGARIDVRATVDLPRHAIVYIGTFHAPYVLYVNGERVGSYAHEKSYPEFLGGPPPDTQQYIVDGKPNSVIEVSYTVPENYWGFRMDRTIVGTYDAVRIAMFAQMGFEVFFGVMAAALGLTLMVLAFYTRNLHRYSRVLLWLGALSLALGCWIVGECDLSSVILKRPGMLYLLAYMGLFCVVVPVTHLSYLIMDDPTNMFGRIFCHFAEVLTIAALIGQITGLVPYTTSIFAFYVIGTAMIFAIFIHAVYVAVKSKEKIPKIKVFFLVGLVWLGVSLGLELLNYYWLFIVPEMFFGTLGAMGFIVFLALSSALYAKQVLEKQEHAEALQERLVQEQRLAEVKQRQQLAIIEANKELRHMRHDLKHQLGAMQGFCEASDKEGMQSYIQELLDSIPKTDAQRYCPDFALNALIGYYVGIAQERELQIEVTVDVPANLDISFESDMCSVAGNLLENGIRAATQVQKDLIAGKREEAPVVRLRGRTSNGILTLTQDNSYLHVEKDVSGEFKSTRGSDGIGLKSIKNLASKWNGNARFEAGDDGIFRSSVYVRVKTREDK